MSSVLDTKIMTFQKLVKTRLRLSVRGIAMLS